MQLMDENPTQPWEGLAAYAAQASKAELEYGLIRCIEENETGLENARHLLEMGTDPNVSLDNHINVNLF